MAKGHELLQQLLHSTIEQDTLPLTVLVIHVFDLLNSPGGSVGSCSPGISPQAVCTHTGC